MASNWYIDGSNGGENSAGTAANGAWDSFAHALATLATAATANFSKPWNIFVAPVVNGYHESVIPTGNLVGANAANGSYYYGDVSITSNWASAAAVIHPGIVRITLADGSELPQAGTAISLGATVGHQYFYDFQIDGVANTAATNIAVKGSTASGQEFTRCVVVGSSDAFDSVAVVNCVAICCGRSYVNCRSANAASVAFSVGWGDASKNALATSDVSNCFVIGGSIGASGTLANITNNTFIAQASQVIALQGTGSISKNLIMGGLYGFRYATTTPEGCLVIGVSKDAYTPDSILEHCIGTYVATATATTQFVAGHTVTFNPAMQIIRGLAEAFTMKVFRDYTTDYGVSIGVTDIEGRSRLGYTGTYAVPGAVQSPVESFVKSAGAASKIQIDKMGEEVLYVPLTRTTSCTISLQVSYINGDTAPEVAFVFDPSGGVATKTEAATSYAGHTFNIAIATNEVAFDQIGKLIIKGKATTATATAIFHSLVIT
jgi:hypothetical protein